MKKTSIIKTSILLIFLIAIGLASCGHKKDNTFVIGIPDEWGNIEPPVQLSVYTDVIISNQFEPLVRVDKNGMVEPLTARSWNISANSDEIRFKIDTTRRFSNGKFLTAQDVKNTWEEGLLRSPNFFNGAFRDILSRVEGYENFNKTHKMSGLIVDGDYFTIKFKEPLRAAIDFLSNVRFGVFLKEKKGFIGTGPYKVIYNDGKRLEMVPNEYFTPKPAFSKVEIMVVKPEDAKAKLKAGEIQAYLFAEKAIIRSCSTEEDRIIKCISGREGRHEYVSLNGFPYSIFSNPKYRKAVQSLLLAEIQRAGLPEFMRVNNVRVDKQVFLKFQAGRLSDQEADEIIKEGDKYIPEFINATKKHPVSLLAYDKPNWIQELLEKRGVVFTKGSGLAPKNVILEYYNGRMQKRIPDMLVGGVSVAGGDPGGLYHTLGRYGSHTSALSARPAISKLLEEGRSILDREVVDEHYKKVSRAVLREVPFVHIGFSLNVVAYRADKVKVNTYVKNKEVYGLNIFEPY